MDNKTTIAYDTNFTDCEYSAPDVELVRVETQTSLLQIDSGGAQLPG